jgi:hypothetical protein
VEPYINLKRWQRELLLVSDGRETRPALTVSFRLERGGQFESGFQFTEIRQ